MIFAKLTERDFPRLLYEGVMDYDSDIVRARLKKVMASRALSLNGWSKLAGVTESTLRSFMEGKTKALKHDTLWAYAKAVNMSVSELTGEGSSTVPLVGYVGAGQQVLPIDDHMKGAALEEVEAPPGGAKEGMVALRVRGDSMQPAMHEGWLIYYSQRLDGGCDNYIGRLCVVKVLDGPTLVKTLRKGYTKGRYNLHSYNAEIMEDMALEWCAKVEFIKPA